MTTELLFLSFTKHRNERAVHAPAPLMFQGGLSHQTSKQKQRKTAPLCTACLFIQGLNLSQQYLCHSIETAGRIIASVSVLNVYGEPPEIAFVIISHNNEDFCLYPF